MNKFKCLLTVLALSLTVNYLKAGVTDTTFSNQYTIYLNQPLGFSSKARVAIECKFNNDFSWVLNYTRFYGLIPGQHGFFEVRKYTKSVRNIDHTKYAKIGVGHSFESVGFYALAGVGIGQKIYLDKNLKFSLYCVQGLKLCPNIMGVHDTATGGLRGLFYFSGPGAFLDINFNLSYRF